jgi:hypothetical protein
LGSREHSFVEDEHTVIRERWNAANVANFKAIECYPYSACTTFSSSSSIITYSTCRISQDIVSSSCHSSEAICSTVY